MNAAAGSFDGEERRRAAALRPVLYAPAWELIGLFGLVCFYLLAADPGNPETTTRINTIGPMILIALLGGSALRMSLLDPNTIWTALFWLRISVSIYYGVGNLVPVIGDEDTYYAMQAFYPFDDHDISELNLIYAVSLLVMLLSSNLVVSLSRSTSVHDPELQRDREAKGRTLFAVGMAFLAIGGFFKYFFVIPYYFKLSSFVLPESITTIANFTYAAIYLLTVWALEYRRSALPLVIAFVILDITIGILDLQKYAVLISLIIFALAFLRSRITFFKIVVIGAALAGSYAVLVPIVELSRFQFNNKFGIDAPAGFADRFAIVTNSFSVAQSYVQSQNDTPGTRNSALSRISYVNQSSYAIDQYDSGTPGNSLDDIFAVFIPRLFWPDKPIITQIASDYNYAITGNPLSQTSPGLFADAYWDAGWQGVIIATFCLGILFSLLSLYSLRVMHKGQWLYFPIVLLAMKVGYRVDGYLVADMVGGSVILYATRFLLEGIVEFPYDMFLPIARGRALPATPAPAE
ncbi:MAG TPA: hypothetical protein VHZ78_10250 [Rhizomicrobium sp.]|nr:hypothetical protein [Rhizomicrobium sp.]